MKLAQTSQQRSTVAARLEDLTEERLLDQRLIRIPARAATFDGFTDWALSASRPDHAHGSLLGWDNLY